MTCPSPASRLATRWIVAARSAGTRPLPRGRRPAPPGPHAPGGRPTGLRRRGPCCGVARRDATGSQPGQPAPRRPRDRRGQFDQQGLGLAVRRLRLLGLSGGLQQTGDGGQAAPHVGLDLRVGRGFGRQRLAGGEHLPVCRQRVLRLADLARQLGHFVVRLPQRPPRGQVRLLAQQGTELAVEVAGRLQAAGRGRP